MGRLFDGGDKAPSGQIGGGDVGPVAALIFGNVQQAIIAARPEHALFVFALDKGRNCAIMFRPAGVQGKWTAGGFEFGRVIAGQVRADRCPRGAFIGRAEDVVATGVEHTDIVGREADREGPGEAIFHTACAPTSVDLRPDGDQADLFGAVVVALQGPTTAG